MTLRRGFKKEAHELSRELRSDMGLSAADPINVWDAADFLGIPVLPLSHLTGDIPSHVAYLAGPGRDQFFAVTVFDGPRRMIVHNDSNHPNRQASDIAHELAHGLLGHPATPPLNDHGCRHFDRRIEEEANWLGPALLVSEEAALHVVEAGIPEPLAAVEYGVSEQLLTFRIGVTGARRRVARRRGYAVS